MLWGVALLAFRPHYWTIDDVQMSREAAGRVIAVEPDARIQFSHVAIGSVLVGLHRTWPGVPWYAVYMLCVHAAAHVTLLLVLLIRERTRWGAVGSFAVWFGVLGLTFTNRLQFTVAAYLAGMTGGLLILTTIDRMSRSESAGSPSRGWRTGMALAWGAALVLLCSMIRWPALKMVAVLLAPIALVTLIRTTFRGRVVLVAGSAVVVAACGLARWYDGTDLARGAEWWRVERERYPTSEILDYHAVPYSARTKPVFDAVGWSENDYHMLLWNWWSDRSVFEAADFDAVLEHRVSGWDRFSPIGWLIAAVLQGREVPVVYVAVLLSLWFAIRAESAGDRWVVVATIVASMVAWVYLAATLNRVPPWVLLPLGTSSLVVSLAIRRNSESSVRRDGVVLGLALIVACAWTFREYGWHIERTTIEQQLAEDWDRISGRGDEVFLVGIGTPWLPPPLAVTPEPEGLALVYVAASQTTEATRALLANHGVTTDIVTALVEDPKVLLVCNPRLQLTNVERNDVPTLPVVLSRYIREHHGKRVKFVPRHVGRRMVALECRVVEDE